MTDTTSDGSAPDEQYAPDPNVLERSAAAFLKQRYPSEDATPHALGEQALGKLRRIERRAVVYAALAGILSGLLIGGIEVFVRRGLMDGMQGMGWTEQLPYWIKFFALAGVVSGIEILFLYWNALRAIGRIGRVAGIRLKGSSRGTLMVHGLARTALEFPNPRRPVYGIDPYALMPKWKFVMQNLLYRMKVGISSFIVRVLLRRMLGRAALRGAIPLVTGPLYAIWNAIIVWRIMRQARELALGPYAVEELVQRIAERAGEVGERARQIMLDGVGEMLMRSQNAHPNYIYLLSRLMEELDCIEQTIDVDWSARLKDLPALNETERQCVVELLVVASLLGGKLRGGKLDLLREACEALGLRRNTTLLPRLHRRIMQGQRIDGDMARSPVS
ncbi:MAG: hypothetical protein LAT50_18560 [Ectothiorhodospiraceae bacterium]|nr:hypothetical protein [Ectothiorhodospiraceae bacterium]